MKKFKVGDRVEHRSSVTGSVADVLPSGNYYVRLDRPAFPGDDCMWAFGESELSPLAPIPDGWTPASEPAAKRDPRVRYCVAADLPTSITVWHDTFEAADAEAQRLCVKCGKPFRVLKVVEEVKPGEPVITKLEE